MSRRPEIETPLRVLKIHADAQLPLRAKDLDAGYDLFAVEDAEIPAGEQLMVPTGWKMDVPAGTYGRIAPRSGLALKKHIHVMAGVIDKGYRGEVNVILRNFHHSNKFVITKGSAIAQMILERIETPPVEEVNKLDETDRGSSGFGSTDIITKPEPLMRQDNESAERYFLRIKPFISSYPGVLKSGIEYASGIVTVVVDHNHYEEVYAGLEAMIPNVRVLDTALEGWESRIKL